jgi:hypothetical protein
LRGKRKSGPTVWAAPPVSAELGGPHNTEVPNRRKPHHTTLYPEESRPDASGEDDLTYFRQRPHARTRVRSAFPGEFSKKILKQGRGRPAVVVVAIARDDAGNPTRRARGILFPDGGRA